MLTPKIIVLGERDMEVIVFSRASLKIWPLISASYFPGSTNPAEASEQVQLLIVLLLQLYCVREFWKM